MERTLGWSHELDVEFRHAIVDEVDVEIRHQAAETA